MNVSLIVEIVVTVLLVGTFGMCLALNRRLGGLRANQEEMRRLIVEFDRALVKARQGVAELKAASQAVDTAQEDRVRQARQLKEELGFMIETAERLADRLAGEAVQNRQLKSDKASGQNRMAAPQPTKEQVDTAMAPFPRRPAAPGAGGPSGLGNVAPTSAPNPANPAQRFRAVEPRSEAERELLMALRQAR